MKQIFFNFNQVINSGPVRNRLAILKVVLLASQHLIYDQFFIKEKPDLNKSFLFVDKMSRLFIPIHKTNSFYSVVFPFSFRAELHKLSFNQVDIDNSLLSHLNTIMNTFGDDLPNIESMIECCWDVCREDESPKEHSDDLITVFTELLTFDIGYIRYDYDNEHQNDRMHPLHHFDINYSNQSTYKIGLEQSINSLTMKNILDVNQECWFLKQKN